MDGSESDQNETIIMFFFFHFAHSPYILRFVLCFSSYSHVLNAKGSPAVNTGGAGCWWLPTLLSGEGGCFGGGGGYLKPFELR